jgi:hypothetical protein
MPRPTVLACLLLLTTAAPAAATKYAAPTGTGFSCSQAAPCPPATAVAAATTGEEVVLAGGTYPSVGQLATSAANVDVHGPAAGTRAVIQSTQGSGNASFYLSGAGDHLHDIDIVQTNTTARGISVAAANVVVERVSVSSSQTGSFCFAPNTYAGQVIRDSICNVTGSGSVGVNAFDTDHLLVAGVTLRVPNGDAADIRSVSADTTATLVDTILVGGAAGHDIDLSFGSTTNTVTVTTSYSDYDQVATCASGCSVSAGAGNITAAPAFVSASDLHQTAASPTVDKGIAVAQLGASDIDGDPRAMGDAPDMGADELRAAPTAGTATASALGTDTAAIGAPVDARGAGATFHVEYGPTTDYGLSTPETAVPAGAGPQDVSALLTGLTPATGYHARVVTTGQFGGPVAGGDVAFSTLAPVDPGGGPPPGGDPLDTTAPTLTGVRVARGRLRLTLSEAAKVTVRLRRGKKNARTITRRLTAGRHSIRIRRAGLRRGRYRLLVVAADAAGNRSRTVKLSLRR